MASKRAVVADANGLMMPFQFGFNLDSELERLLGSFEIVVPTPVLGELEALAGRDRRAKAALALARRFRSLPVEGPADDAVLEAALQLSGIVLTNDRVLLGRCRRNGIPRIRLRSGSHLVYEGPGAL